MQNKRVKYEYVPCCRCYQTAVLWANVRGLKAFTMPNMHVRGPGPVPSDPMFVFATVQPVRYTTIIIRTSSFHRWGDQPLQIQRRGLMPRQEPQDGLKQS